MKAKKSLGQHFLTSTGIAKRIVRAGRVEQGGVVLEIGPGKGILTRALLESGAKVLAVEKDDRAIPLLEETFRDEIAKGQLTLVHGDALTLKLDEYGLTEPYSYSLVANIPYYITGAILRTYLSHKTPPLYVSVLVQKEVAVRIARSPKASILSLSVQAYGKAQYIETVQARFFKPEPKVDSAILAITLSKPPFDSNAHEIAYFDLLHIAFGQKRKQLFGTLSKQFDKALVASQFEQLGISHTARAETIPLATWIELSRALSHAP